MQDKFLVFFCTEVGAGHLLLALLQSAFYAYSTKRVLAIDMRRFIYFARNNHDQFFENFSLCFPSELSIITDVKEVDRLLTTSGSKMIVDGDKLDITKPYEDQIVVVPCYAPGSPYSLSAKRLGPRFQIALNGELARRFEIAKSGLGWQGGGIGLHFRSMTGEFVERMNRIVIPDFDDRMAGIRNEYIKVSDLIAGKLGVGKAPLFVTSDDTSFTNFIMKEVPGAVTSRPSVAMHPNKSWTNHLSDNNFDISILSDAVNDIWLLSDCAGVVRSPHSAFSQFAVLNGRIDSDDACVEIHVPTCAEILASLTPSTAVQWARRAFKEAQARRKREDYPLRWYVDALRRAGELEEAKGIERRAGWLREALYSSAANVPGEQWDPSLNRGDGIKRAIRISRRLTDRLPGNPYVLAGSTRSLSHLLSEDGQHAEAVAVAREAINLDPGDAYLRRHLAQIFLKSKKYGDGEAELRQAIALSPDNPVFFGELGECLLAQKRPWEASELFEVAIALAPREVKWRLALARILQDTGQSSRARSILHDALAAGAHQPKILEALSILNEQSGNTAEAIRNMQEAIHLEPNYLRWKYRLAHLQGSDGNDIEATRLYKEIVEISPGSAHANHALSVLAERRGDLSSALDFAQRAAAIEPTQHHRHTRVGEILQRAGDHAAAERSFQFAVRCDGSSTSARYLLSKSLQALGRVDEALIVVQAAAELQPLDPRLQGQLASLRSNVTGR